MHQVCIKNILIVATDNNSRLVDWTDRGTSILFGDGAGAVVVTQAEDGIDDIIAIDIKADGNYGNLIELSFDGKNCPLVEQYEEKPKGIRMNGRGVYTFVAKNSSALCRRTYNKCRNESRRYRLSYPASGKYQNYSGRTGKTRIS